MCDGERRSEGRRGERERERRGGGNKKGGKVAKKKIVHINFSL